MTNILRMKFRILLYILFTLSVTNCLSQNFLNFETYNVDSLLLVLPGQGGEERVNTLNDLAGSIYFKEFDLGEQYAEEALNLAKELDYQEGIADAYWNFARMYGYHGNFPDGLNIGFEALHIYEKLGKKNTVARLYAEITMAHYIVGNFEKAIEYGHITLDKYRERPDGGATVGSVRDTIYPSLILGVTYRSLGMFDKSLKIFLELLKAGKRNNFGDTEMVLYTFLVGSQFYFLGETDSAKLYLEKALAYPDINQNVQALKYRPLTWLGFLQYEAGDFDTAIFHLRRAFEWYNKNGYLYWAIYVSNHLGRIHYEKNKLNSAEKYYRQSEMLFNEALTKKAWLRYDSLKFVVAYGTNYIWPSRPLSNDGDDLDTGEIDVL